jgi:tRNA1Val (adenine37-N6)-methyltransferase
MEKETLDEILNGGIRVFQKEKGYRFSIDSILLAHFAALKKRTRFIDIGCGSGIILLILAKRFLNTKCVGLEIQEQLAALARKNSQMNHLESRVEIVHGDARQVKNIFPVHSFDTAIFNPPYRKLHSGRINSLEEKAIARHEIIGSLKYFLTAAKYLLKTKGTVFTIYPAKRLVELVYLFRLHGIEPKKMKLVFPDNASDASFVLVEGKKDCREELKLEPPLFIYDQSRRHTREMSRIFSELSRFPAVVDG